MAGEFIQIEIDPERIHMTFGSQCDCEQEKTITLADTKDCCGWPLCPNCDEEMVLVSVIVDVPMFNYGKEKKTSGSENNS